MSRPATQHPLTFEEYLDFEERSPIKNEFVAGEIYALSGVRPRHNLISLNIASVLREAAREGPCRVYMADVKLLTPDRRVYYPDVMVVCTPGHDAELLQRAACLVVEVTSPSSARTDRHEKLAAYQGIPELVSYLVVDQDRRRVEHHRRWPGGAWQHTEFVGEGQLSASCPPSTLTLDAIYEGIEMPADGAPIEGDEP